jgi:hypothetical protein
MPKEARLLSVEGVITFRTCAPRTPVTDFPLRDRGSLCVALIDCGPVGRLEAAERHRDRREAFFRHQVAMRG